MSEIKFRAWDNELKEMLYSKTEQFDDALMFRFNKHFETERPIFMQYTGLKDKNGKEIYEGDVVKMHYFFENYDRKTLGAFEDEKEVVGVVKIDKMSVYTECKEERFDWINYLQEPEEELEVIGNIHDNPELLGGGVI